MRQEKISIKTIELKAECFKKTEEQLKKLSTQKEIISAKEYKTIEKQIMKQLKQELKLIDKQYPIEKEIEKFLQED